MSQQPTSGAQSAYALVVMTNGDVYFISHADRARLKEEMMQLHKPLIFHATDVKKHSKLEIFTAHISSIVMEG